MNARTIMLATVAATALIGTASAWAGQGNGGRDNGRHLGQYRNGYQGHEQVWNRNVQRPAYRPPVRVVERPVYRPRPVVVYRPTPPIVRQTVYVDDCRPVRYERPVCETVSYDRGNEKVRIRNTILGLAVANEIFNDGGGRRDVREGAVVATLLNELLHR